jgi:6-phosphogluconolactonase
MTHVLAVPTGRRLVPALCVLLAWLGAGAADAMAHGSSGAVYTLTNSPAGNAVKAFHRAGDGALTPGGQFSTGGTGTGAGLGNQGALVLEGKRLFAVNPGSDSVASFRVDKRGLRLVDVEPSGGDQPISLTVHRGLLYVLNAGGAGNISGLQVSRRGGLAPLPGSTRPLSGPAAGPAQVAFDPDGETLVVTEKATNLIVTYEVDDDSGLTTGPVTHPSAGATPFGFGFDKRDHLIVSEAFGGAPDASAVSSYEIDDGEVEPITPSAHTTETAACWIVVTRDGRFTYTTNTGSGSITGYRISRDGELSVLDADGRTGLTGPGPIDMALSRGSRFLYSLNAGDGTISGFRVGGDGRLTPVGGGSGLPDGATGLAAR